MKFLNLNNIVVSVLLFASSGFAQTTLPAGSNVDGDFAIGNSTNKGGLTVTGQTGSTAAPGINVTGDGGVVFSGTLGTGQIPATGAGTRLMWYSKKAAFRVGSASASSWSDGNIGNYSVALGEDSSASGVNSFAMGGGVASGIKSVAFGQTLAAGTSSFGNGISSVSGDFAIASGIFASASGDASTALGQLSNASGQGSAAFNVLTTASGDFSFASGMNTRAAGSVSFALGEGSSALGDYSFAGGFETTADAYGSFVIGRYNTASGNATEWAETDSLFVIGNGTGDIADAPDVRNRDAFVVRKNGDVKMTAKVTMPRQGDILMGEFGNPE